MRRRACSRSGSCASATAQNAASTIPSSPRTICTPPGANASGRDVGRQRLSVDQVVCRQGQELDVLAERELLEELGALLVLARCIGGLAQVRPDLGQLLG